MSKIITQKDNIIYAVSLIMKAVLFAAAWAGKNRKRGLKSIAKLFIDEKDKEIVFLRERVYQLEAQIKIFQKQTHSSGKARYNIKEQLFILWHMEYFQIPKRHVTKTFGITGSTSYRWLREIDKEPDSTQQQSWNKTPESLALLGILGVIPHHLRRV